MGKSIEFALSQFLRLDLQLDEQRMIKKQKDKASGGDSSIIGGELGSSDGGSSSNAWMESGSKYLPAQATTTTASLNLLQ